MRTGWFDWKGLLVAIVAAAIGIWIVQPGATPTLSGQVAALAGRMHGITPKQMADGSTLRSVTASDAAIVLTIDGRTPWQPALSDEEATAQLAAELCAGVELRDLIGRGAQVRVEGRTPQGEQLPVLTVDRCAVS
jgi:hypothetical protein